MDVFVKRVGLADVAFEPVDGEVHLGEADGGGRLFLSVEGDAVGRVLAVALDEVAGLDEHSSRAAGGIKDDAVVGLDDVYDDLDEGRRGEEFAAVLGALHGELHEEVFVDAAEDVAGGVAKRGAVEDAEEVVAELFVVLGELAGEGFKVTLDGVHGVDEG